MKLTNKVYDVLKYIARYVFPALGTLYFTLAGIWGLPYGEEIIGTLSALTIALNLLLGLTTYEEPPIPTQGTISISPSHEAIEIDLSDETIASLEGQETVNLEVKQLKEDANVY